MGRPNQSERDIDGLEHDPEKWEPVFGKDHAQTKSYCSEKNHPALSAGNR